MEKKLALAITAVLLLAGFSSGGEEPTCPMPCAAELASMSACLSDAASPLNGSWSSPSAICCNAFLAAAIGGARGRSPCLCLLFEDPHILALDLDVYRLEILLSSCRVVNSTTPLLNLCRGLQTFRLRILLSLEDETDASLRGKRCPKSGCRGGGGGGSNDKNHKWKDPSAEPPEAPSSVLKYVAIGIGLGCTIVVLIGVLLYACYRFRLFRRLRFTWGDFCQFLIDLVNNLLPS